MTPKLRCKAMSANGEPCKAPPPLVDPGKRLCPSHDPANKENLREAGRRGAATLHRRYAVCGLDEKELPPLTSPEVAELWRERIAKAVATGRMPHQDARAATSALQQWLKAHEVGKMAGRLDTLKAQLDKVKYNR